MNNGYSKDLDDSLYTGAMFQSFFKDAPQSVVIKANAPYFTILAVSDRFVEISLKRWI
jgi:two-component system sensor histidine kinase VicK